MRCHLDAMRLARVIARGGLLVDMLVGNTAEWSGLGALSERRASIPPPARASLLRELCQLDGNREPAEEVLEREETWQQRTGGWPARLSFKARGSYFEPALESGKPNTSLTRLLICDLAVQLYAAEHGEPPGRLQQLVPRYLRAVPEDPFSGRSLVYQPLKTSYLLYSIGPDLDDDGGKPIPGGVRFGDGDLVIPSRESTRGGSTR